MDDKSQLIKHYTWQARIAIFFGPLHAAATAAMSVAVVDQLIRGEKASAGIAALIALANFIMYIQRRDQYFEAKTYLNDNKAS